MAAATLGTGRARAGGLVIRLDIGLRRGGFATAVAADFAPGVTGIFGPSGSGKTTLLHLIAGLLVPDRGRIEVDGEVLVDREAGIVVPAHRRRIGLVFQHGWLFPHYSVEGNLRYGERLLPSAARRFPFDRIVDLLRLRPLLARRTAHLSGGERQRVALGRALLAAPRLLLCDEPLSSLDRGLKQDILPFLARLHAELGVPMLYVSHDLGEILRLTDRVLVLDAGSVVAHGRCDEQAVRAQLYDPEVMARLGKP
jgi:molybdate transport system ATP-binding protein